MKKIITILVLTLLGLLKGMGQISSTNPTSTNVSSLLLPNVTPPSPEAFSITEYGNIGSNEYRGKPSIFIPLYTYKAGQLNLPIRLSYTNNGVKVNDLSTWTGMNWVLSAGGVITRTVKDLPDEDNTAAGNSYQRVVFNNSLTSIMDAVATNCAPNSEYYYYLCHNAAYYDTEHDIFKFNFDGYSGSFVLDGNFNPVILNDDHELKITIGNGTDTNLLTSKTIIITTPNGVKYFFGGIAIENTRTASGGRMTGVFEATTSFYLYKIEHPINGSIFLEYKSLNSKLMTLSKSYNEQIAWDMLSPTQTVPNRVLFKTWINSPKYLSKITSSTSSEEVDFISTDYPDNENVVNVLNRISVKNNQILLHEVAFDYLYDISLHSTNRFFLNRLEFNKNLDTSGAIKHELYKMEYNDPLGLPERLSNSQDIDGFYNGKTNLSLLIRPGIAPNFPYYADRSPDFEKASKGVLTKLYYPTGGYTLLEYEPNPAKKEHYTGYSGEVMMYYNTIYDDSSPLPRLDDSGNTTLFGGSILKDQKNIISISVNALTPLTTMNHTFFAELTVTEVETGNVQTFRKDFQNYGAKTFPFTFLKDMHYTFNIHFIGANPFDEDVMLTASYSFEVMDGYETIEGLGIRLKRQTDYSNDTGSNIKRYYYNRIDFSDSSTANYSIVSYSPKYSVELISGSMYYTLTSESSNKYTHNDEYDNAYEYVSISYGGDNFEDGGSEKWFSNNANIPHFELPTSKFGFCLSGVPYQAYNGYVTNVDPNTIFCFNAINALPISSSIMLVRDNANCYEETDYSTYNGNLIEENIYKKIDDQLFKVKKISNSYPEQIIDRVINFIGMDLFYGDLQPILCNQGNGVYQERHPVGNCYKACYYNFVMRNPLIGVTTTEFIEPIPMSVYLSNYDSYGNEIQSIDALETPYRKIVNNQYINYGTLRGLPTEIITTTSEN